MPGFTQRAVKALFNYAYPGNIHEMQNLIERAVIMVSDGEPIDVHHLFRGGEALGEGVLSLGAQPDASGGRLVGELASGPARDGPEAAQPPAQTLESMEAGLIAATLRKTGGNASAAGRHLGITRATLIYRARQHGLAVGRSYPSTGGRAA